MKRRSRFVSNSSSSSFIVNQEPEFVGTAHYFQEETKIVEKPKILVVGTTNDEAIIKRLETIYASRSHTPQR